MSRLLTRYMAAPILMKFYQMFNYVKTDPRVSICVCLYVCEVCVCPCVCVSRLYSLNGWADVDEILQNVKICKDGPRVSICVLDLYVSVGCVCVRVSVCPGFTALTAGPILTKFYKLFKYVNTDRSCLSVSVCMCVGCVCMCVRVFVCPDCIA